MDDSPHASHWQEAAAAGEAFIVTAAIAGGAQASAPKQVAVETVVPATDIDAR